MDKKILFVDDELHLLDGLRRALRGQRKVWDMHFVQSAAEALELVRREGMDVMVTDMHMPGMDGAKLLEEVVKISPRTIRMVLTGHSDEELVMRSVGVAHQYLNKPSDADTLRCTVARALRLRDLVRGREVRDLVAGIHSLPSLPRIYREITERLQTPDFSLQQVGRLIAGDPPMTAKLLQLVNSAFFGIGRRITDPGHAATLLGLETIRNLVLVSGVFSQFRSDKLPGNGALLDGLWQRSLQVGGLAKKIAEAEEQDPACIADSMVAGLLHRIGSLVVMAELPEQWGRIHQAMKQPGADQDAVELAILGTRSGFIGGYLLGLWGLPDAVVEAVSCHANPGRLEQTEFLALTAVHVAQALVASNPEGIDEPYLQGLGLSQRLDAWKALEY